MPSSERWGRGARALVAATLALACAGEPSAARGALPKGVPTGARPLCVGPDASPERADCWTPASVEARLLDPDLEVLRVRRLSSGSQDARVWTLWVPPDGAVFEAKARAQSDVTPHNDPTAGTLVHALQALVLAPTDHVVPPTVTRCLEGVPRRHGKGHAPAGCTLVHLSYWLSRSAPLRALRRDGVLRAPDGDPWDPDPRLFDPERFERDPAYRRAIANLNLIVHLIGHGDAHAQQFVAYEDPFHVFLVDSSTAFSMPRNPAMDRRQDLASLIVPALPADTAARVRALERADVEGLAHAVTFERRGGAMRRAEHAAVIGDPDKRVRDPGSRLQIGLRDDEVEALWSRVRGVQRALRERTLGTLGAAAP
ncbi:MAG TPA: hypothetical protein RMH99_18230 [Sandaracinaceae bacterium LLY-WYZ-13_1]|nr:hypothetical protein [Sandaracinaceae bacterium LLY-WYZ-13_1]